MEYYEKSSAITIITTFHMKGLIKTIELQEVNDDLRKSLSTSMPSSTEVDRLGYRPVHTPPLFFEQE